MKHLKIVFLIITSLFFSVSIKADEKIIDFTLKSHSGENLRITDYRGQVVMLNFWASWCTPCVQEFPYLEKIHQRYSPAGFTLLGVNIDNTQEKADSFLKKQNFSFPIVYDHDLSLRNKYKKFQGMPLSIFIDCDGNINKIHRSYNTGDEKKYIKIIKSLLKKCSA